MSGKSKEEIAFDLVSKLKGVGVWGENNRQEILDMYADCLEATSGMRSVNGRTPVALRLAGREESPAQDTSPAQQDILPVTAKPVHPAQNQVPPAFQQPQVQPQAQPQIAPSHPPQVHQQQQRVQQAYQPQPGQAPQR